MRYQFVLITLALCLQVALLWTLGMRIDSDTGAVAIQPEKVLSPKPSPQSSPAKINVPKPAPAPLRAQIKTEPPARMIQQLFFANNRDHQVIEQAIRDQLEYVTGSRPIAPLTDQMVRNLTYLDLKGKGLSDIRPLVTLQSLQQVDLERNRVTDLRPLERLPMLNAVYLRNNAGLTMEELRRAGSVMRQCIFVQNLK